MSKPTPSSPEGAPVPAAGKEMLPFIVSQPEKLGNLLDAIESLTGPREAPTEQQGEHGGGNTSPAATGTTTKTALSSRDQAIANLPPQEKMQQALRKHIQTEVRKLRREASHLTTAHPGNADRLNKLYANIRRLNKLLLELLHTSYETLKHFFIRVFIDRQPIL